jgi:hypothetical protein
MKELIEQHIEYFSRLFYYIQNRRGKENTYTTAALIRHIGLLYSERSDIKYMDRYPYLISSMDSTIEIYGEKITIRDFELILLESGYIEKYLYKTKLDDGRDYSLTSIILTPKSLNIVRKEKLKEFV